ncbi:MAG: MBL fold metallo-hydrolase, partial [Negativicoccus succinicivorans]|nr:MBL fold metallo-hydrolase [Negativicoccus succinicivorans]
MPKTQFNTLEDLAREIANGRGQYTEKNTIKSAAQDTPRIAPRETMAATERPELEMVTLASSSKGNATLVRTPRTQVLVDCGISARRITQALAELHVDPAQLAGVLLTHEHSDHVKGLAAFLKRYPLPVYTT